jgi:hypothetical protein
MMPKDPVKAQEARRKMSEAHKGKPGHHFSEESRRKMSETKKGNKSRLGKHHSEETKRKIGDSHRGEKSVNFGKHLPEATRKKMSELFKGRKYPPITESTRKKLIESHLGHRNSPEAIEKTAAAHRGKKLPPLSDQHKQKLRVANLGKQLSIKTREKIRISNLRAFSTEKYRVKHLESLYGGFWYGNVRYYNGPQYCEKFNENLRERVRAYRGYVCFECGTPKNGRKLAVHHVHYNKKTCCDGSPHDLVPLCESCHSKTNGNRDYWEDHFTEMIYNLDPDGKCFFTKEEMSAFKMTESIKKI